MAKMNKALEAVRVGESRKLAPAGTPGAVEKNRWCRDHHQGTVDGSLPVPKFAQAHRRVPEPTPAIANNARTKPIRRGISDGVILLMDHEETRNSRTHWRVVR